MNINFINFIEKQHRTSNITQNITDIMENNTRKLINEASQPENEKLMTVSNIQSDQEIKYRYTQNCLFLLSKIIEYLNKESNLEFKTILEEGISVLFGYMISILYNKDETVEKVANLNQSQLLYFSWELIYINAKAK